MAYHQIEDTEAAVTSTVGSNVPVDTFVKIPSFKDMLVNNSLSVGRPGDSDAYTGWIDKGEYSDRIHTHVSLTVIPMAFLSATAPHSNPKITG